jgi:large subunit ribosomal protein L13
MGTFSAKKTDINREWFLVDANGKNLGRLATAIAMRLRGKHKPEFTPHVDCGDYVVIINAEKIAVTGNKLKDKIYYHHTGFQGGIKSITLDKMLAQTPERVLTYAIKGMLPKGPLGRKLITKLKVYAGDKHPHEAQQLKLLEIKA